MSLSILLYTKGSWSSADRTQKVAVNEAFPRPKLNHFDLPLVTATPSLGLHGPLMDHQGTRVQNHLSYDFAPCLRMAVPDEWIWRGHEVRLREVLGSPLQ